MNKNKHIDEPDKQIDEYLCTDRVASGVLNSLDKLRRMEQREQDKQDRLRIEAFNIRNGRS